MSIRPLPKLLQEKTEAELNEIPSQREEDLNHIREWILKQTHLKVNIDDQWLMGFLRGCKFRLEAVKKKLDAYYTMRFISPELFHNKSLFAPEIHAIFKHRVVAKLPNTSNLLEPQRFLIRYNDCDPEKIRVTNGLTGFLMLLDTLVYADDQFVVNGQEVILDLKDVDYRYTAQMSPTIINKALILYRDIYPIRVKRFFIINMPIYLQFIANIILPTINQKMKERLYICTENKLEELYENVPRSILPEEYGGQAGPFSKLSDDTRNFLEKHHDWIVQHSYQQYDESKKLKKSACSAEYCSMDGSFRKLTID